MQAVALADRLACKADLVIAVRPGSGNHSLVANLAIYERSSGASLVRHSNVKAGRLRLVIVSLAL